MLGCLDVGREMLDAGLLNAVAFKRGRGRPTDATLPLFNPPPFAPASGARPTFDERSVFFSHFSSSHHHPKSILHPTTTTLRPASSARRWLPQYVPIRTPTFKLYNVFEFFFSPKIKINVLHIKYKKKLPPPTNRNYHSSVFLHFRFE